MTTSIEAFQFLSATADGPFIALSDDNTTTLEEFKRHFGGDIFQLDGLWIWQVRDAEAVKLAEQLIPELEKNGSKNCMERARRGREMISNWKKQNN